MGLLCDPYYPGPPGEWNGIKHINCVWALNATAQIVMMELDHLHGPAWV